MIKLLDAYHIAKNEIGIKEISGAESSPRIVEYHTATSLKAQSDEVSWCSAFVNWCVLKAGLTGTDSAAARSWAKWGVETINPVEGDIVVLQRGEGWQGHVGFYVERDERSVTVLGGNQNNEVCARAYKRSRVICYRTLR